MAQSAMAAARAAMRSSSSSPLVMAVTLPTSSARVGADLPHMERGGVPEVLIDDYTVRARECDFHDHPQLWASFCASDAFAWNRFATSNTRFIVPR
jgi:hypothetical protein